MQTRSSICGMTLAEIETTIAGNAIDGKYGKVIATDFYRRRISDFDAMDTIPRSVRKQLISLFRYGLHVPVERHHSVDGSVRYLFRGDNDLLYESVFIPAGKRRTLCVSTQSGCRMGCPFCLTASIGFRGNLSAGEILNQVLSIPETEGITHVVFMGMGEPFDNIDEVLKCCRILTSQWGFALSPRNITVSTVGITDGVRRFLEESDCNLTLSLFSPFAEERIKIVPAEKANPSREIIEMMRQVRLQKKRRLSIAYIMIDGLNDSDEHLDELIVLLKSTPIRVNLLPYHSTGKHDYRSSVISRMNHFRQELFLSGISASVRRSRGADVSAACGLLASGLKKGDLQGLIS